MKWDKYTIDTTTEAEDFISMMLSENSIEGIEIEDNVPLTKEETGEMFIDFPPELPPDEGKSKVSFYLEAGEDHTETLKAVRIGLEQLRSMVEIGSGDITSSQTEDIDWINNWKTFFKPFRAADDIVIKPTWEEYKKEKDSDILIEIDPGIAFGTGSHETTKLCIQALDKYVKNGDSVLDVGCGSGILSIAALKLGAKHATAIDIDEVAVKVAAENMAVNHIPSSDYTLYDGDLISNAFLKVKAGTGHDIVVANILADVIIPLTGVVKPHLKKGGLYITSGIIDTKEAEVREALLENGFEILDVTYMKEWCCFIATI